MEIFLHPLTPLILLSVGLGLGVFLFVSLKRELRRTLRACGSRQGTNEEAIRKLQAEFSRLNGQLAEIEEIAASLPRFSPPERSINVTRRTHVLRMHRRGERPEQIAAALGLPRNEVELLVKVHRMARP